MWPLKNPSSCSSHYGVGGGGRVRVGGLEGEIFPGIEWGHVLFLFNFPITTRSFSLLVLSLSYPHYNGPVLSSFFEQWAIFILHYYLNWQSKHTSVPALSSSLPIPGGGNEKCNLVGFSFSSLSHLETEDSPLLWLSLIMLALFPLINHLRVVYGEFSLLDPFLSSALADAKVGTWDKGQPLLKTLYTYCSECPMPNLSLNIRPILYPIHAGICPCPCWYIPSALHILFQL